MDIDKTTVKQSVFAIIKKINYWSDMMSIESDVFKRRKVCFDKLEPYGFKKEGTIYKFSKPFLDDFRADIEIDEQGTLSGKVYDMSMNEEYINIRIESQVGSFVSQVREEYQNILEDIANHCFEKLFFLTEQANRITESIKELYQDTPEFPWENLIGSGIFRNPRNEKWYGLIMNIDKSRIDKTSSGEIEIINVKLDPEKIKKLLTKKGFYPAYHMNKKNWITLILDETLPDNEIVEYIKESYQYTAKKEEWIVPANPKFYDVVSDIQNHDIITWKQSSNINVGDIVYLYVGAPYSAILCQCEALEVNIPYEYKDKNLSIDKVMKLKITKRYPENQFTFLKLNEYGVKAIRGPRSMPKKLSEEMNK